MSLLSEYRLRIHSLLAADDIEQTLVAEGVSPAVASRIAGSRAVVAQASVVRRGKQFVKGKLDNEKPAESRKTPEPDKD